MKKILGTALVLALAAILCFGGAALAWDYEDPCVASNEDFFGGGGWDDGSLEFHFGDQLGIGEGYNLYRDDTTNTGNLDKVLVYTLTPDEIDLPFIGPYLVGLVITGDESPDTWYWATEPRGYNAPPAPPNRIKINLPDASVIVQYCGQAVDAVDFNDGTWRIQIPAGTWILDSGGSMAFSLVVDSSGNIVSDVRLVFCRGGEVAITKIPASEVTITVTATGKKSGLSN